MVGGQGHAPAVLICEIETAQLHNSLCGPQIQSGLVPNFSPPTGFELKTLHSAVSRYADCTIPTHKT